MGGAPVLAAFEITKRFGAVTVLHEVDFDLVPGEVHALIGENGAGKSTLMKVLSGYEQPSEGRLVLDGAPTPFPTSTTAERAGIVMIHQELALAEHLTVEANIFLGRELRRGVLLDTRAMRARARELLAELGSAADPRAPVSSLAVSDKQLVEIAKALAHDVRVLIMDEPTAVLTGNESRALFRQIERLQRQGVAILYTSHKLDEVRAIADRVTVLRDGRHVATEPAAGLSPDAMARLMVGRELADIFPAKVPVPASAAPPVLEVEHVSVPGLVDGASFTLRRGEVLGFAGLVGAGRTELMEGLMGLRPVAGGTVRRHGRAVRVGDPKAAGRLGMAYLTEDRKGRGLLLEQRMRPNLTLAALRRFTKLFVDERGEEAALDEAVRRYDIRSPHREIRVGNLSGGNQQKLLLAKTLLDAPEIVIVDEPTRGIDIGTKQQIYGFIQELAAAGKSVVVISSEMAEIIGLSHRVVVMHRGRVTGILDGDELDEETIVRYATGLERRYMDGMRRLERRRTGGMREGGAGMSTLAGTEARPARWRARLDLKVVGPLLALALLIALGVFLNPQFLSVGNVTNVLARSAFIGIIAVGATFVITSGGLDLSVGSMAAFIAGVMIVVMNAVVPTLGTGVLTVLVGMGTGLALGTLAGAVNGLAITKGRIEAFIVTLGTMGVFRSLVTWLADGGTLSLAFPVRETYRPVYYDGIAGVAWPIVVFALVAILGEIAMRKTAYGRRCAATGSNELVARYSAIDVDRLRLTTYVIQGLCVAVATLLYVPRLGSASGTTGLLWELEAIAAVIIGGTVLKGGFGRVWGTVVGVLILSLIDNLLNLTSLVSPYLNGAIQGAIIIVAVLLQRGRAGG